MESNGNQKKTVVIFPGAWSRGTAELWLAFVIKFFERLNLRVVVMHYEGVTIEEMVLSCWVQIKSLGLPDGVLGVAYSMGGIPLRLLARDNPRLFSSVILLASTTRKGLPWRGYIKGVLSIPWEFIRGIFTGQVTLDCKRNVAKSFFNARDRYEPTIEPMARSLMDILRPEPISCCLGLIPLPFFHGDTGPMPCRAVAIVPRDDILFAKSTFADDPQVMPMSINGDHGSVLDEAWVNTALNCATILLI